MKKLYIIRHAKSSWKEGEADFDRGLKRKGKITARYMGAKLVSRGANVEQLISSSAKRTRKTTGLLNESLNLSESQITFNPDLYLAASVTIINYLHTLDDSINEVALVGHNPGVTDALNKLAGEHFENMPTSSMGCVIFSVNSWSEINGNGKLGFFIFPKMFKINFENEK